MIGEEPVVHVPEPALFARALGRGSRGRSLRMDSLQWEVQKPVRHNSRVHQFTLDARQFVQCVIRAVGALEVRKLH